MRACAAHLAPTGVAHISFNTQPGGHFRGALRELAQWYAGRGCAEGRAGRAGAGAVREPGGDAREQRRLRGVSHRLTPEPRLGRDDHLVHDLLASDWSPVWFSEFAAHAGHHRLRYVGEAAFHRFTGPWAPEPEQALRELAGEGPRGLPPADGLHGLGGAFATPCSATPAATSAITSITAGCGRFASDPVVHSPSKTCRPRRSFQRSPRTRHSP